MNKFENVSIGSWLTRPDYAITEVMATSGLFKWLTIDIEHSTITLNQAENMIRIIQLANLEAYVRISENNPTIIKRILDAGANGIIVPMINTEEDTTNIIKASFYPPRGSRGVGLARAQNYGPNFKRYIETIEQTIKIIVQI
ncbi:MAG: 2,4-dihydroxyhept-2-ene-1,7-dioic acid aldolase, partial [Candidatus Thermoplasmatota archaeon]|nr:2,4-dihydroxyhept-2-ene-1,7-dioic acid aldolase [Candidatus Thermoplasmatota archaeon]